jgi:hypothetical protein
MDAFVPTGIDYVHVDPMAGNGLGQGPTETDEDSNPHLGSYDFEFSASAGSRTQAYSGHSQCDEKARQASVCALAIALVVQLG